METSNLGLAAALIVRGQSFRVVVDEHDWVTVQFATSPNVLELKRAYERGELTGPLSAYADQLRKLTGLTRRTR